MDQIRQYVWAQVVASKLSIHGLPVAIAAQEADHALEEFDKRFPSQQSGDLAAAHLHIDNLTGRLNEAAVKVAQFEQVQDAINTVALPNDTVVETVQRLVSLFEESK